jgi:hypothetical protein
MFLYVFVPLLSFSDIKNHMLDIVTEYVVMLWFLQNETWICSVHCYK